MSDQENTPPTPGAKPSLGPSSQTDDGFAPDGKETAAPDQSNPRADGQSEAEAVLAALCAQYGIPVPPRPDMHPDSGPGFGGTSSPEERAIAEMMQTPAMARNNLVEFAMQQIENALGAAGTNGNMAYGTHGQASMSSPQGRPMGDGAPAEHTVTPETSGGRPQPHAAPTGASTAPKSVATSSPEQSSAQTDAIDDVAPWQNSKPDPSTARFASLLFHPDGEVTALSDITPGEMPADGMTVSGHKPPASRQQPGISQTEEASDLPGFVTFDAPSLLSVSPAGDADWQLQFNASNGEKASSGLDGNLQTAAGFEGFSCWQVVAHNTQNGDLSRLALSPGATASASAEASNGMASQAQWNGGNSGCGPVSMVWHHDMPLAQQATQTGIVQINPVVPGTDADGPAISDTTVSDTPSSDTSPANGITLGAALISSISHQGPLPSPVLSGLFPLMPGREVAVWMQIVPGSDDMQSDDATLIVVLAGNELPAYSARASLGRTESRTAPQATLARFDPYHQGKSQAEAVIDNDNATLRVRLIALGQMPDGQNFDAFGFQSSNPPMPDSVGPQTRSDATSGATSTPAPPGELDRKPAKTSVSPSSPPPADDNAPKDDGEESAQSPDDKSAPSATPSPTQKTNKPKPSGRRPRRSK